MRVGNLQCIEFTRIIERVYVVMHVSSIKSYMVSWFLLCFTASSVRSEPQGSYRMPFNFYDERHRPINSGDQTESPFREGAQAEYNRKTAANAWSHVSRLAEPQISSISIPPYKNYSPNNPSVDSYYMYKVASTTNKEQGIYFPDNKLNHPPLHSEELDENLQEDDILMKINALEKVLSDDSKKIYSHPKNTIDDLEIEETEIPEETKRVVRQVRKQRPGFFWTLAKAAFETFNDTRSAIQQINEIVGSNFEPEATSRQGQVSGSTIQEVSTEPSINQTTTPKTTYQNVPWSVAPSATTEKPYKFTRIGVQSLLRRNIQGLVRLFNIEWTDALNQSETSVREFQKDLGNQIGSYLQDNPDAY